MRAVLFLVCILTLPLCAQRDKPLREIVQKYLDAREKRDAKAVEALFTGDADQLVSSGEWRKGRDEVVRGTLASSDSNSGRRTIVVESVRFTTADSAVVDGRYELGTRKMWTTFFMVRTPAGWRIAAIRNMLPAAAAASTGAK